MTGKLCFLCRRDLYPELSEAIAAEGWDDVAVSAYETDGRHPPERQDELRSLVASDCTKVVLIDSGASPEATAKIAKELPVIRLPARHMASGPDFIRLTTARLISEWRLDEERKHASERGRAQARERADQLAAMDFLAHLAQLTDEHQTVAAIEELFTMLFAPRALFYVKFENGAPRPPASLPRELRRQLETLKSAWAWTRAGTGFIVRIARAGNTLGAVAVDHFAFPEFRERYLNLALSVAGVCALSIENARTYQRMKSVEEALRRSERSLRLAQSIAHLGHWEWVVDTDDISWSDETYRILGYSSENIRPSRDAFLQAIHPDDRARVEQQIHRLQKGERFDLEYRIAPMSGGLRVVRGMGEVVRFSAAEQPRIIGTLQEISPDGRLEVLGVIQDITERKELEWRLEQEARTDPLTGCDNRRYFLQQAESAFARARRYNEQLSVFMLDLDNFKSVNDRYGHNVGDAVLQKLVQISRHTLRHEDLIGRLGGEEFAVMLPETGYDKALDAAERLREAIATGAVVAADEQTVHVTASIGVATQEPGDETMEAMLGRADRALYQAKNEGRNRVVGRCRE